MGYFPEWAKRLLTALGMSPDSRKAPHVIKGTSKHARGKCKPQGWKEHKKMRRMMAKRSRRINRLRS